MTPETMTLEQIDDELIAIDAELSRRKSERAWREELKAAIARRDARRAENKKEKQS